MTHIRLLACLFSVGVVASALTACGSSEGRSVVTMTTSAVSPPTTTTAPTFADLVAKVRSGIVRIETDDCSGGAIGTGFLLNSRLVATVEHVIDGASGITLKRNGKVLAHATVIGADSARDLALVRADKAIRGYHFTLASRAPRLGEDVAALGFPLGLPFTVTRGSVSGSGRTIPIGGLNRRSLVQTDAAVNPGNSGGPLIADNGSVVGLVDLGTTEANGLAFAVSSLVAGPLLEAWKQAPQPVSATSCGIPNAPSSEAAAPPPSSGSSDADAAQAAVYTYWSDLQLTDYRAAFDFLSPSEQQSLGGLSTWLNYYASDPVVSVNVVLTPATVSGNTASVSIASLETVGGSTGCKDWSGGYQLIRSGAGWLINYANLHATAC